MIRPFQRALAGVIAAALSCASVSAEAQSYLSTTIAQDALTIWRDYNTDGIPTTGPYNPQKSQIRQWGADIGNTISTLLGSVGSGTYGFTTLGSLNSFLNFPANTIASVYSDPTPSNNGIYLKVGASGSGSWLQVSTSLYGLTPTWSIANITTLAPGAAPTVSVGGTAASPNFSFGLPTSSTIQVGTVTALNAGSNPVVYNGGTTGNVILDFGLPVSPTVSVGTVTPLSSGSSPSVSVSGSPYAVTLSFGIPRGAAGSFTWLGAWSGSTAYVANDVVYYNNNSYIALNSNTNDVPTDTSNWNPMTGVTGAIPTFIQAPPVSPSGYGFATIIGVDAGVNWSSGAIESTIVGYFAGGSNGCGSSWAPYGTPSSCLPASRGGGTGLTGPENTLIGWSAGTQMTTAAYNTSLGVNTLGHEVGGSYNVGIGVDAMRNGLGYSGSVAVGFNALRNVDGQYDVALGFQCMIGSNGTTGSEGTPGTASNNVCIGYNAMSSAGLTTAANDVIIGNNAGNSITSGYQNTAIGIQALQAVTTQGDNIALGFNAGAGLQSNLNIVIGDNAMQYGAGNGANLAIGHASMSNSSMTTPQYDVAIGNNTLGLCTNCAADVALGWHAASSLTSGQANAIVGFTALQYGTGSYNTALGSQTLQSASETGSGNTAIGWQAGYAVTSGFQNTILGFGVASGTLTTGSKNILIGTSTATDAASAGANNEINIGGLIFGNTNSLAAPSVSGGTSPTIDGHANNRSGTVTFGSGSLTSGTITFAGSGYSSWAHCRVTAESAGLSNFNYDYSLTAINVFASSLTSAVVDYDCDGY